ncbi:hypothetical protein KGD82_16840 [Nocardiopsis eucommiae]|uniref:Uncharacterized protein n=1 Tax=Nocardiopsis eucommiae TaxID=2831970 RepID=A0A975QI21_9ACTN|nr:hypothetical protein KGD82_16840 [Nocardiopsis eucommiae]
MKLNNAIDQARQDQGLSWTGLWKLVGVSEGTGTNLRYARTNPRPEHVASLEDALNWDRGTYWHYRQDAPTSEPATTPAEQLAAQIDAGLTEAGLSVSEFVTKAGISRATFYNLRNVQGQPRAGSLERLETTLGWTPGTYQAILDGKTQGPLPIPVPSVDQQLRMVGSMATVDGTLTWVEHPDGSRDYTLARDGERFGLSITRSSLSPDQAVEDLRLGRDITEALRRRSSESI